MNDSGLNTKEVEEALAAATTEEEKRYLQRVLDSRGVRKATVSSHEIVEGNPDAYPKGTVEQQKDLAVGRPHSAVAPEDTAVRGNEATADKSEPVKAQGNQAKK